MAKREMIYRRLYDSNARTIQRVGRGMNGRRKVARERHRIKVNEVRTRERSAPHFAHHLSPLSSLTLVTSQELREKLGSNSGVVRAFIDGTKTTESIIAAAETLDVIKSTKNGMDVIFETSAAALLVERMIANVKLGAVVDKTKGGKSEWDTLIKVIGDLETNSATINLILKKGGGRCLMDMMRRGDSGVREEVRVCKEPILPTPLPFLTS